MKCFEKVVKGEILQQSKDSPDALQFAFRQGRDVEDANLTLLNCLFRHWKCHRPMIDYYLLFFSSAFNTIRPHLLVEKCISPFNLDHNIFGWILDFLLVQSMVFILTFSVPLLHLKAVYPILFIMYTNDCRGRYENSYIIKYANDSSPQTGSEAWPCRGGFCVLV